MEILTMKKEREKRFKNNLEKQTKKIRESNVQESTLNGEKLTNHINQNLNNYTKKYS